MRTLAGRISAPLPALVSLGAHDHGAQVLFNLEGTGPAADWVPTVVLCATGLDDAVEERLAKLSGEVRHAGVTVVVAGEVAEAAQRRLAVEGDRVRVEPLACVLDGSAGWTQTSSSSWSPLLDIAGDTNDVARGSCQHQPATGRPDELSFEVDERDWLSWETASDQLITDEDIEPRRARSTTRRR